jgi:putative addiction module component (TIGR02574 family)
VETKLQQLTVDERIKLVEDLWDSIAADQIRGRPAADAILDIRRQL